MSLFPSMMTSRKSSTAPKRPPFDSGMSLEDKIKDIVSKRLRENAAEDLRRYRVYLLMDLFYHGYQNVGPWDAMQGWPVYDAEPLDYIENRFRRNVLINAGGLIRMEPPPVIRPVSGQFNDIEAASVGQDAWEKAKEEIAYDQLLANKCIQKCLFGNTFVYAGYRYGNTEKIMVPKTTYQQVQIPGAAVCPDKNCWMTAEAGTPDCPSCGMPMQQFPPIASQNPITDGFDTREKGTLFSTAFSPLEVKIRSRVKGGPSQWPFILRQFKEDIDLLNWIYPDLDITPRDGESAPSSEAALRYQSLLGGLAGNPYGNQTPFWQTTSGVNDTDVVMGWCRPQLFRGDADLEKQFPDGFMAVIAGGQVAESRPAKIEEEWTHEVYYPSEHSAYGDGMFDDIPIQRGINQVGQLTMRHFEYDTIPLRLYDDSLIMVDPNNIGNDPKKKWIKVQTSLERGLDQAVRDLNAQQLSFDVNVLRQDLRQVDQTISGATDPRAGQIPGANTPYSAQILAVEQGQTLFLPSGKFNKDAVKDHVRNVLNIAKTKWIDPRTLSEIDQNTGRVSWKTFAGTDLSRGNWNVTVMDTDFAPKTRGEQMTALEQAAKFGIDVLGSPRLRLSMFEKLGLPPDGDMVSTQAKRASRVIERIKNGEQVQPNPLVDDGMVQWSVIQDFLAGPQGDELQQGNGQAWQAILEYGQTVLTMTAMKNAAFGGMGLPPSGAPGADPAAPPGAAKKPDGQPGPTDMKQENGQSPVPPASQQPLPTIPARVQQANGTLPS